LPTTARRATPRWNVTDFYEFAALFFSVRFPKSIRLVKKTNLSSGSMLRFASDGRYRPRRHT
jgi:hypothetical protein